jgi:NifU-like protein involved in Fe-S cluster formation
MSMLSDEILGKELSIVEKMTAKEVKEMLGVPVGERRFKCALLSLHTVKNALHKSKNEPVQGWTETVQEL